MFKFSTNMPSKDGEMHLFFHSYLFSGGAYLEAWDIDGPYADVTENIPEVALREGEVCLNHDLFFNTDFVEALTDFIGEAKREVTFGPFSTKTFVLKLKDGWEKLCTAAEF